MTAKMKRREFITLLGGAAVTWPLAVRAQQPAMPVIGFFSGLAREAGAPFFAAFRRGLHETGRIESRNVQVVDRWAEGQYERLPQIANELVHLPAAVIVATGGAPPSAKAATTTIPIVFVMGEADPVKTGLVASLNRPGGNVCCASGCDQGCHNRRRRFRWQTADAPPRSGRIYLRSR
jgi:putative ABC transport system substrate-binding protein